MAISTLYNDLVCIEGHIYNLIGGEKNANI